MLTEDYLVRLISMAVAALMRALTLKQAGSYREGVAGLDVILEQMFGLRPDLLKHLEDNRLLEKLSPGGALDPALARVAGDVFRVEGDLLHEAGDEGEAHLCYQRALLLYVEAALTQHAAGGNVGLAAGAAEQDAYIPVLLNTLGIGALPPERLFAVYVYSEAAGDYGTAIECVERLDNDLTEERQAFYRRLLDLTDAQLASAGLSREALMERAG